MPPFVCVIADDNFGLFYLNIMLNLVLQKLDEREFLFYYRISTKHHRFKQCAVRVKI